MVFPRQKEVVGVLNLEHILEFSRLVFYFSFVVNLDWSNVIQFNRES